VTGPSDHAAAGVSDRTLPARMRKLTDIAMSPANALRDIEGYFGQSSRVRAWYSAEEAGWSVSWSENETSYEEQEMNRTKKPLPTRPFFARFLEKQAMENVTGGGDGPFVTLKYPSDGDEIVTLKFPSDNDEIGVDR
jgi:hypothetical protein